jgi:uncharacterized protein with von Willebrand factor type A (vWA) domain
VPTEFRVETAYLDLPAMAGAFSRRLHDAGLPVSAERAAAFARALTLTRPLARRRLYWTARGVFLSDRTQVRTFDAVFASVFGTHPAHEAEPDVPEDGLDEVPASDSHDGRRSEGASGQGDTPSPSLSSQAQESSAGNGAEREVEVALAPSDEELLRGKRFDALSADELAHLYRLMARLHVATPLRRTRRFERRRHGERIDMRRTLRDSMRTGGDPVHVRRRHRRTVRRRLVLLCDISGSMEPYARAYLQFLTSAAGSGAPTEAFAFATRLTRLTRALASRSPERAIQNAAAAAPDWASGTRIGDALKAFNDRHGRRGLARGAVVVILSDGWERGEPSLVAQEMERLARLAYRIVWVNPRAAAQEFVPRAGGMAAALPYVDALVSGHSLAAIEEVVDAIGAPRGSDGGASSLEASASGSARDEEPWGSATPVPGSSVAMPSGYGPSRGRTTPGWGLGGS